MQGVQPTGAAGTSRRGRHRHTMTGHDNETTEHDNETTRGSSTTEQQRGTARQRGPTAGQLRERLFNVLRSHWILACTFGPWANSLGEQKGPVLPSSPPTLQFCFFPMLSSFPACSVIIDSECIY
jgi:hypothetical protein